MKRLLLTFLGIFFISLMPSASAAIIDVTDGKEIRGITTSSDARGYVGALYSDSTYSLEGRFIGLTDPQGDDFYEGWVVRKSPFAFISTGELEKVGDEYTNVFTSDVDYSEYDFYVLTLEPNDGNPAPAEHILEGDVLKEQEDVMNKAVIDKKEDTVMMKEEVAMMEKREALKSRIIDAVPNLSQKKIDIILERVAVLKEKLEKLSISPEKRASYHETLDLFVEVLGSMRMDMMMDK